MPLPDRQRSSRARLAPWVALALLAPTSARAHDGATAPEHAAGFRGGGGLFVLGTGWWQQGHPAQAGFVLGGGGHSLVWRGLRVGGLGGEAVYGSERDWHYRMVFGGFSLEWVWRPLPWLEVAPGLALTFGSGRSERRLAVTLPPDAPADTLVLDRRDGFVCMTSPTVALGFVPVRWLKIALLTWFTYAYWKPSPGYGVHGGLWILFGNFRPPHPARRPGT